MIPWAGNITKARRVLATAIAERHSPLPRWRRLIVRLCEAIIDRLTHRTVKPDHFIAALEGALEAYELQGGQVERATDFYNKAMRRIADAKRAIEQERERRGETGRAA